MEICFTEAELFTYALNRAFEMVYVFQQFAEMVVRFGVQSVDFVVTFDEATQAYCGTIPTPPDI